MAVPKSITWDQLICGIQQACQNDDVNTAEIQQLLAAYKSNEDDWKNYAHFNPSEYARNLIVDGKGRFHLLALCWGAGQETPIHNHPKADGFVKVLKGRLTEYRYNWPKSDKNAMQVVSEVTGPVDAVIYITDEMGLHRVKNPSNDEVAVSLHLYTPPYETCQIFDPETGRETTLTLPIWSKYGVRCDNEASAKLATCL